VQEPNVAQTTSQCQLFLDPKNCKKKHIGAFTLLTKTTKQTLFSWCKIHNCTAQINYWGESQEIQQTQIGMPNPYISSQGRGEGVREREG
jgi:hypothetical protein